jgi:hypothetical protein
MMPATRSIGTQLGQGCVTKRTIKLQRPKGLRMKSRIALFIAAIITALLPLQGAFADKLSGRSSPQCLVPVKYGQPTGADFDQSFRMTWKVVTVLGLDRPVIFPSNRSGVWTINSQGAYVPFGGDFPSHYLDDYASDMSTGDVIGVSGKLGVFRVRSGERRFHRLYPADGKPFARPFSAVYVERLSGTVISDNSGLYLLTSTGKVQRLRWDRSVGGKSPGRIFDLPELKLMLFATEGYIYARDDSGDLRILDKGFDGLHAARVTADGEIFLKRNGENLIVPWPPKDSTRCPAQLGRWTSETFEGIEVNNRTIVKVRDKRMSVRLPAGFHGWPVEFPGGTLVAEAGRNGVHTLNDENTWDSVDKSREISGNLTKLFQLPVGRQALLINADGGLFLLVRKPTRERSGALDDEGARKSLHEEVCAVRNVWVWSPKWVHASTWIVLALCAYITAGPYSFASCWRLDMQSLAIG